MAIRLVDSQNGEIGDVIGGQIRGSPPPLTHQNDPAPHCLTPPQTLRVGLSTWFVVATLGQCAFFRMNDDWTFEVIYQEKSIVDIEWLDGLGARVQSKQSLVGEPFDNGIQPGLTCVRYL